MFNKVAGVKFSNSAAVENEDPSGWSVHCFWVQVCKRKCSEVQRCTPCKQPRCTFAAPDGGLENRGVGGGGGEAASNSETGHCHLPLCPLPSSSTSSSSASSSSSSPADGCCGLGLHADLPHSSDSSPCCLHHYDDCQARSSDAADHLSINHLPSSILLKVRLQHFFFYNYGCFFIDCFVLKSWARTWYW